MAVTELCNGILSGLTADTKPTTYPSGTYFLDTQTGAIWVYIGTTWTAAAGGGGSGGDLTAYADVGITNTDSPYTVTATRNIIRANATSGAITINLPTAVGITGKVYKIYRADIVTSTNLVTIDANSTETIDGNLTYILYPAEWLHIESDGANWQVLARPSPGRMGYYFVKGSSKDRRYTSHIGSAVNIASSTSPAANTLWAIPFIVSKTTKFDVISFRVTTVSTSGNARAGLYRDNGNCYPGALIFDTGSIDTSTGSTSVSRDTTITSALQILQPGLYWLAWETDSATGQYETYNGINQSMGMLGQDSGLGAANAGYGYSVTHTFGALPDPYTTTGSLLSTAPAAANPVPLVSLRPI